ncbi:MAG: hypothetical protein AB8G77_10950 [Rhodothermales bacterium]
MRGFLPLIKKSKQIALTATGAALLALGATGCDSVDGQGGEDPPPVPVEACGGVGVLCNVSGIGGELGLSGDGGPATSARHYWPMDITVGPASELFIADWNNHVIRKIDADGTISRFIGAGNLGDDATGPADQLNLNHPVGLTIGPDGHYYLASWHNWKIKKIDKNTMQTTSPIGSVQGLDGDGGPAGQAKMDLPAAVVFAPDGMIYIADQGNFRIRQVTPDGTISTFAGGERGFADGIGEAAQFDSPQGPDASPGGKIVINQDGTALYMADTFNNRIRRIDLTTREVLTIAGNGSAGYSGDGGRAIEASFSAPTDLVITHDNEIFVADSKNHVIRKIAADGTISTVVGTGTKGLSADATTATEAMLNTPHGVAYDEGNHTLYIADTFNQMTKRVDLSHE